MDGGPEARSERHGAELLWYMPCAIRTARARSLRTDHRAAQTGHVLGTVTFPRTQFCVWQDECLDSRAAARKPARQEYSAGRFLGPNATLVVCTTPANQRSG